MLRCRVLQSIYLVNNTFGLSTKPGLLHNSHSCKQTLFYHQLLTIIQQCSLEPLAVFTFHVNQSKLRISQHVRPIYELIIRVKGVLMSYQASIRSAFACPHFLIWSMYRHITPIFLVMPTSPPTNYFDVRNDKEKKREFRFQTNTDETKDLYLLFNVHLVVNVLNNNIILIFECQTLYKSRYGDQVNIVFRSFSLKILISQN